VDHSPRYAVTPDFERATLTDVVTSGGVVVIGADLGEEAPVVELRVLEMLRGGLIPPELAHGTAIADLRLTERPNRDRSKLAVFHSTPTRLAEHAATTSSEDALMVLEGLVSGRGSASVRAAAAVLEQAERPVVIVGAQLLGRGGQLARSLLAEIATKFGARILPVTPAANTAGLAHLRLVPGAGGTEYAALGGAAAAFISRLDPAGEGLAARARGFTVVHETRLTDTALAADVVLPAVTNYEKRGTVVNLEGRLLPLTQAAVDSGDAVDLTAALGALAEALGLRAPVRGLRGAQKLLSDRFGLDFAAIPATGVIAPLGERHEAPTAHTHTPRLWKPGMRREPLQMLPMADPRLVDAGPGRDRDMVGGDD